MKQNERSALLLTGMLCITIMLAMCSSARATDTMRLFGNTRVIYAPADTTTFTFFPNVIKVNGDTLAVTTQVRSSKRDYAPSYLRVDKSDSSGKRWYFFKGTAEDTVPPKKDRWYWYKYSDNWSPIYNLPDSTNGNSYYRWSYVTPEDDLGKTIRRYYWVVNKNDTSAHSVDTCSFNSSFFREGTCTSILPGYVKVTEQKRLMALYGARVPIGDTEDVYMSYSNDSGTTFQFRGMIPTSGKDTFPYIYQGDSTHRFGFSEPALAACSASKIVAVLSTSPRDPDSLPCVHDAHLWTSVSTNGGVDWTFPDEDEQTHGYPSSAVVLPGDQEERIFVTYGLRAPNNSPGPGIRARLIKLSNGGALTHYGNELVIRADADTGFDAADTFYHLNNTGYPTAILVNKPCTTGAPNYGYWVFVSYMIRPNGHQHSHIEGNWVWIPTGDARERPGQTSGRIAINSNNTGGETYENALFQSIPNPANDAVIIRYQLKQEGLVSINIYNALGQSVRVFLLDAAPGNRQIIWDGHDHYGARVSNGVYYYRLRAGAFTAMKKIVMAR